MNPLHTAFVTVALALPGQSPRAERPPQIQMAQFAPAPVMPPPFGAPGAPFGGPGAPFPPPGLPPLPALRDYSWIHSELPPPRIPKVHDIVTVIVDEKAELLEESRFNRQKIGTYKAELRDFVRIGETGNLENAASNQPTVESRLQNLVNSRGQLQNREALRYRIAATIVDVLPNGTLILEARKTIRTNHDVWEYQLTGRIRDKDIQANNTITSENIADLQIIKREKGRVKDSTRRGWLSTVYDFFMPF